MVTYSYNSLPARLQDKAIAELKENPTRLPAHIASLRRWLQQSPHLFGCPNDDYFLLRFLRAAKFDQEKAERRLEKFCTIRGSSVRGLPSRFDYPPLGSPDLEAYLKMGVHIPLECPALDETIVLIRFFQWDPAQFDYERLLLFTFMTMEVLAADQRSQIEGVGAVIDLFNLSKEQLNQMTKKKLIRESVHIWLDAFPLRNRHLVFCHESPMVDMALEMMKLWLKPKLSARIHGVKNKLSAIKEKIPDSEKLLPPEFGGENEPLEICRERWEIKFREFWAKGNPLSSVKVDEALRPEKTLDFLHHMDDKSE